MEELMKKIFMLLSCFLFVTAFIACGDDSKKSTPGSDAAASASASASDSSNGGAVATTVYMLGDSTMCGFSDPYYYPRYGYGTQFKNYLNSNVTINNLAVSGRSSKSFISEANYTTFKNSVKSGDYVIIGFGHNDQKTDGSLYTNPDGAITDTTSFQYYLYTYYVKVALDAGATPILCTPIVRRDSNGTYADGTDRVHFMGAATGDYVAPIKKLAAAYGLTCIDLTTLTKAYDLAEGLGKEGTPATASPWTVTDFPTGSLALHAWTTNKGSSVDDTHLNIFGAKMTAYILAKALLSTTSPLKNYVLSTITAPTVSGDLAANSSFVLVTCDPPTTRSAIWSVPATSTWWGSAFGDIGTSLVPASFDITETATGVSMRSGVYASATSGTTAGKIGSTEGIALYFQQIPIDKDFTLSATATVNWFVANGGQTGFGIMVRDGVWIDTADSKLKSASVAVGTLKYAAASGSTPASAYYAWYRPDSASGISKLGTISSSFPEAGSVINMSIQKVGAIYTCTYGSETPVSYTIDLNALVNDYVYAGLFTARECQVDWSNIALTIK
jgi:lysophospholipase L1-like esterase